MAKIDIKIPTFHQGQADIYQKRGKFNAVRCGRRWGKTLQMVSIAADAAIKGQKVGLFAPEHKQLNEPFRELSWITHPIKESASRNTGSIYLKGNRRTGRGQIDFWSLNDNELAGRGREYDIVMIDEAAFTKSPQMMDIWEKSISPTMLTRPDAEVWVFSTPNGIDTDNFFWQICNEPKWNFVQHYAPTSTNPYVKPAELEKERLSKHPQVYSQEFEAQFIDWSGTAFFSPELLLVEGRPVPYPKVCDGVFAVIDTAVKTGSANDGTAVSYWSTSQYVGVPLVCLDWDYIQIEGAMLEVWIPSVFQRLEELARQCRARAGSIGAYIEDAQSGSILLQQCANRGMQARPLPQALTAAGKDARAINASGPVYQGKVKWSEYAFDKVVTFKDATRNHMLTQVYGFRVGDKDAAKRADDLLDCFTYAIAISLGNMEGIA